jgi:2-phosphosulfolactate phosphatase
MPPLHQLNVRTLPTDISASELAGSTVIVVDLLRASTTICTALAHGANAVIPLLEVRDVHREVHNHPRDQIVLGGERGGRILDQFDLGNSPAEYTSKVVSGRKILLTTTNGTRALWHARQADRILIGACTNRTAVAHAVAKPGRVEILCAGTDGRATREDIFAAGAILDGIRERLAISEITGNRQATAALADWSSLLDSARMAAIPPSAQLARSLEDTAGGRNLIAIGQQSDLALCAQLDKLDVVPEWDRDSNQIRTCGNPAGL